MFCSLYISYSVLMGCGVYFSGRKIINNFITVYTAIMLLNYEFNMKNVSPARSY